MAKTFRHAMRSFAVAVPLPPDRDTTMKPISHPASEVTAGGSKQPAPTDSRDSHMHDDNSPPGDHRAVRTRLLNMIVENERRRADITQPTAQQ